jgi:hypothetical protein
MTIVYSGVNRRLMFVDENGYECWPYGLQYPQENSEADELLARHQIEKWGTGSLADHHAGVCSANCIYCNAPETEQG